MSVVEFDIWSRPRNERDAIVTKFAGENNCVIVETGFLDLGDVEEGEEIESFYQYDYMRFNVGEIDSIVKEHSFISSEYAALFGNVIFRVHYSDKGKQEACSKGKKIRKGWSCGCSRCSCATADRLKDCGFGNGWHCRCGDTSRYIRFSDAKTAEAVYQKMKETIV